jgi:hypothetical protein
MKFKKVVWSYTLPKVRKPDTLYLTEKDIDHLNRIYKRYGIQPKTIEVVTIMYLADRHKLLRYIIKELDILLKIGGSFNIISTFSPDHGCFIRSKYQVSYEFSVSTNSRYKEVSFECDNDRNFFTYVKVDNVLLGSDDIYSWSFGIITNGLKNDRVSKLINSIILQKIPNFEILVCGKYEYEGETLECLKYLSDIENEGDIRAPISKKKNIIASHCTHQNIMILHDRYTLPSDWHLKMIEYGNYFELLSMPNIGGNKGRVSDWNVYSSLPSGVNRKDLILPEYTQWSPWWYAQGGILIVKKDLYLSSPLDDRLHWGELEDVQFSQIANLKGWFYYFDINNKVITESDRLPESRITNSKSFYFLKLFRAFLITKKLMLINMFRHYKNRFL